MKVWRVEAEDGTGPYGSGVSDARRRLENETGEMMFTYSDGARVLNPLFAEIKKRDDFANELCDAHSWTDTQHPGPFDEGWLREEYEHKVFGFYSIEQARAWFAGYGQKLTDVGYHLSEYDVDPDEIKYGKYQIAFTVPKGQTPVRHPVIKEIP